MKISATPGTTAAADARLPGGHPFAAHLRRAADAEAARTHSLWTPEDGPLPSLYVSHGAPMLFELTDWMTQLHTWARTLRRGCRSASGSTSGEAAEVVDEVRRGGCC